jgi:hypothetical protein
MTPRVSVPTPGEPFQKHGIAQERWDWKAGREAIDWVALETQPVRSRVMATVKKRVMVWGFEGAIVALSDLRMGLVFFGFVLLVDLAEVVESKNESQS